MNKTILARSLIAGLALPFLPIWVGRPALASRHVQPTLFALGPSDFPAASRITRGGVESNRLLGGDDLLPPKLSLWTAGRLTGYAMRAIDESGAGLPRVTTSYLVSIYASRRDALAAWELHWSSWFALFYYTDPPPLHMHLGDRGVEARFSMQLTADELLTEIFFQRGAILVEVFQEANGGSPSLSQSRAFYRIAEKLSALARRHRSGW